MTPRPTSDLPQRLAGRAIARAVPATWIPIDSDAVTGAGGPLATPGGPGGLSGASSPGGPAGFIDLICAEPRGAGPPGFAENCVVTVADLPPGASVEDWHRDSTAQIMTSIPGAQLIDITEWDMDDRTGLLRSGVYINDTVSVTVLQGSWVSGASRRGFSATFSCPTRSCDTAALRFSDMALTLEEI